MTFVKFQASTKTMQCWLRLCFFAAVVAALSVAGAHAQVTITDINPDQSTLDPADPDGASGGRVNGLAAVVGDPDTYYAASEWGGLYKTTDFTNAGGQWFRLESHLPMVTWDVEVDPSQANPGLCHLVFRRPGQQPVGHQCQHRCRRHLDQAAKRNPAG